MNAIGGFRLVGASPWRRKRLLILCYHGVSLQDEHEWASELFVTREFLRRRLQIIKESDCNVLRLGEAVRRLADGTLPPRSVAITFDDGFHDFLAAAVPLLEEFGYPATNYISTYYCIHQRPIPALALRYLLWRARFLVLPPGVLPGLERTADLADPAERDRIATELLSDSAVVSGGREAQHAVLAEVADRLSIDWDEIQRQRQFHLMTPQEVTETARRGFDCQLHTHRHRTPRDRDLFCGEVRENKRLLEEMTGQPAVHFCYPSGVVHPSFLPWLREVGVMTATTGFAGMAARGDEPLLLSRYIDTMGQTEDQFGAWLCGVGTLASRRRLVNTD